MTVYRYARWDGTQSPIGEDVSVERIVEEISEDILEGLAPEDALRRMMRRGIPGEFGGLQSLLRRLRRAREQERNAGRLGGWLEQMREQLDRVLEMERTELAVRDDADSRVKESYLDSLPEGVAGQISELKNYDFTSAEAREAFRQMLEHIRAQMLDAYVRNVSQGMREMTPEQRRRMKDMLADLNRMLQERAAGTGPSQESFDAFMARYGDFFPENPRTLDELMEALARRAVAMSRLMASLSPEQRAELEALSQEMLADLDLAFEVGQLWESLREMMPDMPWDEPAQMDGDEPLGLTQGLEAIERIADYDELERALKGDQPGARIDDVDVEKLKRTLGEDAVRDLERLKRVERALEDAGVMQRRQGTLELTARGIRKLGERALATVFERLVVDRPGSHDARAAGGSGEPTGATKPFRWGDPYQIDVRRTVHNAVIRQGPSRNGVRLKPEDFEAIEAESRTTAATVLLLDMSFSMPLRGHWIGAKRMALALQSLISTKYPEDHLSIVGFNAYAREMSARDLVEAGWEHVYGTNYEHAFSLAGRLLAKQRGATKQVLLVTDGEPTAHLVGDRVEFHWPPVRETIEKSYREAMRLARAGVTMNIFMLEDSPSLVRFIDRLAKVVSGRVFAMASDELGDFVVRDYLKRRAAV